MRLLILLVVCTTSLFVLDSCKRKEEPCHDPANPKCVNYDPCYGVKPVKAEIELSQVAGIVVDGNIEKLYFKEDYTFPQQYIRFSCPLEGAKYTWTLGAETITTREFERHFYSVPFGTYSVKLIVEKEPNKNCYPADDGRDTLIKTFQIVPVCQLQSVGIFKGLWDNKTDSTIISVRSYYDGSFTDSCRFGVTRYTNLQGINDTLILSSIISNTELINYDPGTIPLGNLNLKVNPIDKLVTIDCYLNNEHRIFNGRKIAN